MTLTKATHKFGRAVWRAIDHTLTHDGIEHAGYLAFLGLLALFPFLVLLSAIVGFMGQGQIGMEFLHLLFSTLPQHASEALKPRMEEIISGPPQSLLTISIIGAIWTSSSAVEGLRTILNRAYHVGTPPAYIWRRLMSIVQLLIFTSILIIGMVLLIAAPVFLHHIEQLVGIDWTDEASRLGWLVWLLTALVLLLAIAGMYWAIPNTRLRLWNVLPGAIVVIIGWIGSAKGFSIYLTHFNQLSLIYGSLGGIIIALIFFYVCNVIFIFGAEFNYFLSRELGLTIVQREPAQPVQSLSNDNAPDHAI